MIRRPDTCAQCGKRVEDLGMNHCRSCLAAQAPGARQAPERKIRRVQPPRVCRGCHAEFQPKGPHQFYCTVACRREDAAKREAVSLDDEDVIDGLEELALAATRMAEILRGRA